MSFYNDWGFIDSPFDEKELTSTLLGESLLVGRFEEVNELSERIKTTNNIITIEGMNGVGKTSLINITLFEMYNEFLKGDTPFLFLGCKKIFQIDSQKPISTFKKEILLEIADTLKDNWANIKSHPTAQVNFNEVNRFFESEFINAFTFGTQALTIGAETTVTQTYESTILYNRIEEIVGSLFTDETGSGYTSGSIICVIDNLELMRTSDNARQTLEEMRDIIFNIPGVKWILCGSNGIVSSLAQSQRLSGYIEDPLKIKPIVTKYAVDLIDHRKKAFAVDYDNAYLPFTNEEFVSLFRIVNNNPRLAINYINKYCSWINRKYKGKEPNTELDKEEFFGSWLLEISDNYVNDLIENDSEDDLVIFSNNFKSNKLYLIKKIPEEVNVSNLLKLGLLYNYGEDRVLISEKGLIIKYLLSTYENLSSFIEESKLRIEQQYSY